MTQERFRMENAVLARYLPRNMFRFCDMNTDEPYLQAGVITNDDTRYVLHFKLENFPNERPRVYVEEMLHTQTGELMNSKSYTNYTLGSWNGWTQICHYDNAYWTNDVSLWKVYIKCRLWLEVYRAHLRTGEKMDYYLNHQTR